MSCLNDCIEYFQEPGFQRMIKAWIEKYKSLGHLGGKIKLDNLSLLEQEKLGLFLGLDLSCGYLHITYSEFYKRFQKTKFEDVDFLKVLKSLQSSPIYTFQELRDLKKQTKNSFKETLFQKYIDTNAYPWLVHYFQEERLISKYIQSYQENYLEMLSYICEAINNLPVYHHKYTLLSVFSQKITRNPHYFDHGLSKELLLKAITFSLDINIIEKTIETINDVFYQAGLLRDDLSNNCYICHIKPYIDISGWRGFYESYEPWNMNLYNLMKVNSSFVTMPIYIVENPSVFRSLVKYIQDHCLQVGLICSNGQINLCTYMLLDKLIESGCQLYYAGDYDPEGLLIADKLKQKYSKHCHLWCYSVNYFNKIQIMQDEISSKRIQILKNIQDYQLKEIALFMIEHLCFGYQEGLINIYKKDLLTNN